MIYIILIFITFYSCSDSKETKENLENNHQVAEKEHNEKINQKKEIETIVINYPTGEPRYIQNYDIWGDLTGEWINYYKNGQIKQKGYYTNGKANGIWTYYNEDGKMAKEEFIEMDTNCVKFIALWSSQEIADETGQSKKWVFINYTVDVWEKPTSNIENNIISKLRASSYAELIDFNEQDYKVKAPVNGKIGWINKSHVKSIVHKNRKTRELCD